MAEVSANFRYQTEYPDLREITGRKMSDKRFFFRPGLVFILAASLCAPVAAEITLDGTMGGPSGSVSGPNYAITQGLGKTVGSNLFHSFSDFNVDTNESATFSGTGISNIISRVTGSGASSIDGTLRSTIVGANLFLINPNGLVFGPDASIDVGGAFYASSADYVALSDGGRFDAVNPGASTLSVAPPSAFGFLGDNPGGIQVNDSLLQAQQAQHLGFVGGDIQIVDGNLYAPEGQLSLVSVASAGEVPVDPTAVDLDVFTSLGTITVSNPSGSFPFIGLGEVGNLDVTTDNPFDGIGGGRIVIRGGNFYLDGGHVRAAVIENIDGGGIDIKVDGTVNMSGDGQLLTPTNICSGNAGPITIDAESLVMSEDAVISSESGGAGQGGLVLIDVNSIAMTDSAVIKADARSGGAGGSLEIHTSDLFMDDDSRLSTSTVSNNASGGAGTILVDADNMSMMGDATVNSSSEDESDGQAGRIDLLLTGNLIMSEGAWIISYTETDQDAGRIEVTSNNMTMNDQSAVSTGTFAAGDGGLIVINTGILTLGDSAVITSGTEGSGKAGDVIINADTIVAGGNAAVSSESEGGNPFVRGTPDLSNANGGGAGGDVQLNGGLLILNQNSRVASGTGGSGAGGKVSIRLANLQVRDNSSVSAVSTGTGRAGNIDIRASDGVELIGGSVTTETTSADGGNIDIAATELVYLKDGKITTSVDGGLGNGGNIKLDVGGTVYLVDSEITTSVGGGVGDGGNIGIDPIFVILNRSSITANAVGGNGGNIHIVTGFFIISTDSLVTASSELGIDGVINIETTDSNVSGGLVVLPSAFHDASGLLMNRCGAARVAARRSSLVLAGRGGVPAGPDGYLSSFEPRGRSDQSRVSESIRPLQLDKRLIDISQLKNKKLKFGCLL